MNGTGEHLFDEIKRYVGFNADDEARLRDLAARVGPHQDRIVDDFYAHILAHDDARRSITDGDAQVARLKRTLVQWIAGLFQGPWDEAYYERRARIGRRHVEIDLPQQYMFTAVNVIRGSPLPSPVVTQRSRTRGAGVPGKREADGKLWRKNWFILFFLILNFKIILAFNHRMI